MLSRTWVIGRAVDHAVQGRGDVLRRHAELARLVLEDVDLDDARRLHPVEHDVAEIGAAPHDAGELLREIPHLLRCRARSGGTAPDVPTGGPTSSSLTKVSVPGNVFLR